MTREFLEQEVSGVAMAIQSNGFYLPYSIIEIENGQTLRVPKGISRMPYNAWRVYLAHQGGEEQRYVPDAGDTPQQSLRRAEAMLTRMAQTFHSPLDSLEPARKPGPNKICDTGASGVRVTRSHKDSLEGNLLLYATVEVVGQVTCVTGTRQQRRRIVCVAERSYDEEPEHHQNRFRNGLILATAIRRAYLRHRQKHGHPDQLPTEGQLLPQDYRDLPLKEIDVGEIFREYREQLGEREAG